MDASVGFAERRRVINTAPLTLRFAEHGGVNGGQRTKTRTTSADERRSVYEVSQREGLYRRRGRPVQGLPLARNAHAREHVQADPRAPRLPGRDGSQEW